MKFFGIIVFGVLLQLISLEKAAAANQSHDTFSGDYHYHFEIVVQAESWDALNNPDPETHKKIQRSGFAVFGGKVSIPAQNRAAGYSSRTKIVVRPLRYQLCVLRL